MRNALEIQNLHIWHSDRIDPVGGLRTDREPDLHKKRNLKKGGIIMGIAPKIVLIVVVTAVIAFIILFYQHHKK